MSEARAKTVSDPLDLPPDSAPLFGEPGSESPGTRGQNPVPGAHLLRFRRQNQNNLGGRCTLNGGKGSGSVTILPASEPGFVHIDADISYDLGGAVRYEADVRETWLARLGAGGGCSPASILDALSALAALPGQTTVRVHLQP